MPLALLLLAQTPTFRGCPPEGNAHGDKAALNVLKNRYEAPAQVDLLDLGRLVSRPGPGERDDSKRYRNDQGVMLEGYIVDAKLEGPESCNCNSSDPVTHDFHLWFGLTPTAAHKACMVVEITPRWREAKGWTPAQVLALKGRHVRLTGWMLWDPLHANMAVNSTPGAKLLARATCWEVHPVTAFEVIP